MFSWIAKSLDTPKGTHAHISTRLRSMTNSPFWLGFNCKEKCPEAGSFRSIQEVSFWNVFLFLSNPILALGSHVSVGQSKLCHRISIPFVKTRFPESRSSALLTSTEAVDRLESQTLCLRASKMRIVERRANGVVPICYPNHGFVLNVWIPYTNEKLIRSIEETQFKLAMFGY